MVSTRLTLAELLGTDVPEEQVRAVRVLQEAARTPPLSLAVTVDPRTGAVTLQSLSGTITFDIAYFLLQRAQQEVRRQELEWIRSQVTTAEATRS